MRSNNTKETEIRDAIANRVFAELVETLAEGFQRIVKETMSDGTLSTALRWGLLSQTDAAATFQFAVKAAGQRIYNKFSVKDSDHDEPGELIFENVMEIDGTEFPEEEEE